MGTQLPSPKGAQPPIYGRRLLCQLAGWIKMPLGMEVGLGPRHTVLDAVPQNRAQPPIFGPCVLRPNGWIDQDASWYGDRPRPRRHCVRWGPSFPIKKAQRPNFRRMSIVAKRLCVRYHLGRPQTRRHCDRWGPSSSHGKGHSSPASHFDLRRSPISANMPRSCMKRMKRFRYGCGGCCGRRRPFFGRWRTCSPTTARTPC